MANIKISQLPAKGANLGAQDLVEVAEFTGTGYVSKSITGQEIIDAASGGGTAWGDITGTLSSQTDLNTALSGKQATLVSGTNIKTINGSSVLGSGNLVVGGLQGTQYVYVAANGTDVQNAAELLAAYTTAQSMSPSSTKRITIIAAPANYNFSTEFVMSTQYIDLVSLDGNMSIVFNGTATLRVSANDVFVKGVNVLTKQFKIANALNLLKVENCKGGNNSFGGQSGVAVSGTFTNCIAGANSFGWLANASGTFTNCVAGQGSFGYGANASGIFTNCSSTDGDMFGYYGTANGTFNNCTASVFSFGSNGFASGVFTNCLGDFDSFGGGFGAVLDGSVYYCRLIQGSFGNLTSPGVIRLSIDGSNTVINLG